MNQGARMRTEPGAEEAISGRAQDASWIDTLTGVAERCVPGRMALVKALLDGDAGKIELCRATLEQALQTRVASALHAEHGRPGSRLYMNKNMAGCCWQS